MSFIPTFFKIYSESILYPCVLNDLKRDVTRDIASSADSLYVFKFLKSKDNTDLGDLFKFCR